MKCKKCQLMIPAYNNGTLPTAEQAQITAHIDSCAKCHAEWIAWTQLEEQMQTLPSPQMPSYLYARIMDQVQNQVPIQAKTKRFWQFKNAPVMATFLLAIAVGGVLGNRFSTERNTINTSTTTVTQELSFGDSSLLGEGVVWYE